MKPNFLVFLAGALFGAGLGLSGMTDPSRVVGFLDILGDWDPTLAFVMCGALLVFAPGYLLLRRKCDLPGDSGDPISRRLIIGAILFGTGWGLGGFCPGPAIANLAALQVESLVFVPAMAIGMILVQRIFQVDA